ncbi:22071_t:CDS:1, partial [Racocetra persica]
QSSPKISREQDTLQGLLKELSTPIKGESAEINDDFVEGSENSISKNLVRLYQKACSAETRVMKANQEEISCWYHYGKGYEERIDDIVKNEKE